MRSSSRSSEQNPVMGHLVELKVVQSAEKVGFLEFQSDFARAKKQNCPYFRIEVISGKEFGDVIKLLGEWD